MEERAYKYILFSVKDGVATITLNRPERSVTETPRETMAKEKRLLAWVGKQPDAAEGVRSFLERRPPQWKLRASVDLPDWPEDEHLPDRFPDDAEAT